MDIQDLSSRERSTKHEYRTRQSVLGLPNPSTIVLCLGGSLFVHKIIALFYMFGLSPEHKGPLRLNPCLTIYTPLKEEGLYIV